MNAPGTAFTDPAAVRGQLYVGADRLTRRTDALHRAKVTGRHAAQVIADLAASAAGTRRGLRAADIGCGRGTTSGLIAERLARVHLVAVDISAALLAAARVRMPARNEARFVCADFHHLPLPASSYDLIVAAFCLYHSPRPQAVIAEIARCLAPGGSVILATKSADSYHELDQLVAASGLDPLAASRPSLYASAHSGNLPALTADTLHVRKVIHETHRFRFTDLAHAAEYLATTPKYTLQATLAPGPAALAAALRARLPDQQVTATSTVTYITACRQAQRWHWLGQA